MSSFLAGLVVFLLVFLAMSLGVLVQGRRLRGSCGRDGGDCQCSPLAARRCPLRRRGEPAG
jgi:hypothetical protein